MKNAIAKTTDTVLTFKVPGAEMEVAGRINYFHRLAKEAGNIAVRAALQVGMLLFQEKVSRGGTFDMWLDQNCDFGRSTCYRYLALLQKSIGAKQDLKELADGTDKQRSAAIDAYSTTVESKSLTEIMCDYGIITKTKSNLGGKREGAGRKSNEEKARLALAAEAAAHDGHLAAKTVEGLLADLYRVIIIEGALGDLETEYLEGVSKSLENLYKKSVEAVSNRHQQLLKKKL